MNAYAFVVSVDTTSLAKHPHVRRGGGGRTLQYGPGSSMIGIPQRVQWPTTPPGYWGAVIPVDSPGL